MPHVNRRQFIGVVGAGSLAALCPPLPLALPPPLKLYTVCHVDYDAFELVGWCEAVWTTSEEKALAWAKENYGGEDYGGVAVKVLDTWEGEAVDVHDGKHERRATVLREAGWQEEGDNECECCGRHDWGMACWAVCQTCYCCPECRLTDCQACEPQET